MIARMYIICVLLKYYFVQWYRKQLSREHLGKVLARLNHNTLTKNLNELKKCHMQCYFRLADKSEFDRPDRHLL